MSDIIILSLIAEHCHGPLGDHFNLFNSTIKLINKYLNFCGFSKQIH
jgi:hypothetical protein